MALPSSVVVGERVIGGYSGKVMPFTVYSSIILHICVTVNIKVEFMT